MMLTKENLPEFKKLLNDMRKVAIEKCNVKPVFILQLTHSGRQSIVPMIAYRHPIYEERRPVSDENIVTDDGIESGITDFKGEAFRFIEKAVNNVFPKYKPVPYIMNAATDSRYFNRVCENCLRFVPFKIDDQQLDSIHGIDENVDIDTLAPAVDFYRYVIKEA